MQSPTQEVRQTWMSHYDDLQAIAQADDEPLLIKRVGLRRFEDMTEYTVCEPPVQLTFGPTED